MMELHHSGGARVLTKVVRTNAGIVCPHPELWAPPPPKKKSWKKRKPHKTGMFGQDFRGGAGSR